MVYATNQRRLAEYLLLGGVGALKGFREHPGFGSGHAWSESGPGTGLS